MADEIRLLREHLRSTRSASRPSTFRVKGACARKDGENVEIKKNTSKKKSDVFEDVVFVEKAGGAACRRRKWASRYGKTIVTVPAVASGATGGRHRGDRRDDAITFLRRLLPGRPGKRRRLDRRRAIGCGAHFFAATGSHVTLLQRNVRLAPGLDKELSRALKTV